MEQKDVTEKVYDKIDQYSRPQFALPVVVLGLGFFAIVWLLSLFANRSFSWFINSGSAQIIFVILFVPGLLVTMAIMRLLSERKRINVGDTGMMSGYAYQVESGNKWKRWIGATLISAIHAFIYLFFAIRE